MGLAINIILLVVAFIAFAIASGFCVNSAIRVTQIPGYSVNKKLNTAHRNLTIGSVIGWISIALIILGIGLMIFFSPEIFEATEAVEVEAPKATSSFGKYALYGLLFFILAGVIIVGVLSAIAANDIGQSDVPDNNLSRRQAIIAASIAIGVFVLMLIVLILIFTYKPKKKETMVAGIGAPDWAISDIKSLDV